MNAIYEITFLLHTEYLYILPKKKVIIKILLKSIHVCIYTKDNDD